MIRRILLGALLVIVIIAGAVYALSERKLNARYVPPAEAALTILTDSATIDRGRHLYQSVSACAHCHGVNADGGADAAENPVFIMSPPNLTRGEGGVIGVRTTAELELAIRHGLRRDSTSLMVMPSDAYAYLSDSDVAALIAYLRQVPPVNRTPLATGPGPIGRALLVAGKLPVQIAPRTVAHATLGEPLRAGRYLATVSGCHACHNPALSGGRVPGEPPENPPARNITPTGIGSWTESDFALALREGKRPDGTMLHPFMPWQRYNGMTDEEVHSLYEYVRSFPGKQTGER